MCLYANNPFRVLGLNPGATPRDVARRVSEFEAYHLLDRIPSYPHDFKWIEPLDRSPDAIRAAAQKLEDPIIRLEESIFWINPDHLSSLNEWTTLSLQRLLPLVYRLQEQWQSESVEASQVGYVHNRTILAHALLIQHDANRSFSEGSPTEEHWTVWKGILTQWQKLFLRNTFVQSIEKRIKEWNDPRLTSSMIPALQARLQSRIVESEVELCKRFGAQGQKYWLKNHILLLRQSSFPSELVAPAVEAILKPKSDPVKRACERAKQTLNTLKKDVSAQEANKLCIATQTALSGTCAPLLNDLSSIDPVHPSKHGLIRDLYAETLRDIAIRLSNQANNPTEALKVVDDAINRSVSDSIKHKLRNDKRLLRENLLYAGSTPISSAPNLSTFYGCGFRTYGQRNFDRTTGIYRTIYYFTLFFIPVFPITAYWVRKVGDMIQFFMKAPLDDIDKTHRWIASGVGALLLMLWIFDSSGNGVSPRPISSTPHANTTSTPLKTDLLAEKRELEEKWARIAKEAEELKTSAAQIEDLKAQKEAIEATYTSATIPSDVKESYSEILGKVNSLIEKHNSRLKAAQKLMSDYEKKEQEYNAMVDKYRNTK